MDESLKHAVLLTVVVAIDALFGRWLTIHTATAMWYLVPNLTNVVPDRCLGGQ